MNAHQAATGEEPREPDGISDWESDDPRLEAGPGDTLVVDVEGFEGPLDLLRSPAPRKSTSPRSLCLRSPSNISTLSPRRGAYGLRSRQIISSWRRGSLSSNRSSCCRQRRAKRASPPEQSSPPCLPSG